MKRKKSKSVLLRVISAICIIALCLTFFVSCVEDTSSAELAQLKQDLADANNKLKALQNDYDTALEKNKALSDDNEIAQQEIDTLKSSNATANQEINLLKNANETAKKDLKALENANEEAEKELETLKIANETTLKELEDIKEQLNDLLNYVIPDTSDEKIKIYIDQGHNPTGYHNSGSSGNGVYEENITFTIGRLLAGYLALDERFEVRLSRPTSSTILGTTNTSSLEARVQVAKDFEADFFISLHVNSYPDDTSVSGIEVHTTEASGTSYEFGSYLLDGIVASTNLRNRKMKQSPSLYVLKNATMPAILVEMGFISCPNDVKMLLETPELFAQGLYNGILNYFNLTPNNT